MLTEWDLLDNLSTLEVSKPKFNILSLARTAKFVLRDKDKLDRLLKKLCHWNDSLDKLTSRVDQESFRRRLRTRFSTSDPGQLWQLELAAAFLDHPDLQSMANARRLVEQGYQTERSWESVPPKLDPPSDFLLEYTDFAWHGIPYRTEHNRATAIYRGEPVIVDWRCCRDDAWRKEHPAAFRLRTESLAKILNSDLRSLELSVLHCVGYLDQSSNVTGYAFRPPPKTLAGQKPTTLHEILGRAKRPQDIPDLGERFKLARALVSTVFEIHNLGWMHKNMNPKNILFWPKIEVETEFDLSKPYLVGFDIARLYGPGEMSEKPVSGTGEELYRHPEYKGNDPRGFVPSFDMYSLGIILFEIGMWRTVDSQGRHQAKRPGASRPLLTTHASDPSDPRFIETVIMGSSVMDLTRFMGIRYRDAVKACLSRRLDSLWESTETNVEAQLPVYLDAVQNQIVDPLATCNA